MKIFVALLAVALGAGKHIGYVNMTVKLIRSWVSFGHMTADMTAIILSVSHYIGLCQYILRYTVHCTMSKLMSTDEYHNKALPKGRTIGFLGGGEG